MRRFTGSLALLAAIFVAAFLAAGCGSTAKNAISNFSPSRNASSVPGQSTGPSASPSAGPAPSSTRSPSPRPTRSLSPSQSAAAPPASQPAATRSAAAPPPAAGSSSSPAPAAGSGSGLIWLWVLLGVVVLAGVIAWILIARAHGRRSAAAAGWRSKVIDAYAQGSVLQDAMGVAQAPGALTAADAGARWSDIQRRADDLTQALYTLREAAPDDAGRSGVADALTSLGAVRSAMDAERVPGGASAQQATVARDRLTAFEASLRSLRALGQQGT